TRVRSAHDPNGATGLSKNTLRPCGVRPTPSEPTNEGGGGGGGQRTRALQDIDMVHAGGQHLDDGLTSSRFGICEVAELGWCSKSTQYCSLQRGCSMWCVFLVGGAECRVSREDFGGRRSAWWPDVC